MIVRYGKNFFKPSEIAERGLITSSVGSTTAKSNYEFVVKQIRNGKLKAHNYGRVPGRNYYLVSEDEIDRFNREQLGNEVTA